MPQEMTLDDWKALEAEVEKYCQEKGWYDSEVAFEEAMALLHEEAAEAGHAWRVSGMRDVTYDDHPEYNPAGVACDVIVKPEGVGSEFADIVIRAMDDSGRYRLGLPALITSRTGRFAVSPAFLVSVNTLHGLIVRASMAWDGQPGAFYQPGACVADVVRFVMQLAEYHAIDLRAEIERKMEYNWTRAYRHGDRRA